MWSLMTWLADSAKSLTVALDRRMAGGHAHTRSQTLVCFVLVIQYNFFRLKVSVAYEYHYTVSANCNCEASRKPFKLKKKIQYVTVGV